MLMDGSVHLWHGMGLYIIVLNQQKEAFLTLFFIWLLRILLLAFHNEIASAHLLTNPICTLIPKAPEHIT